MRFVKRVLDRMLAKRLDILEAAGLAAVCFGIMLVYFPAGVMAAGLACVLVANIRA